MSSTASVYQRLYFSSRDCMVTESRLTRLNDYDALDGDASRWSNIVGMCVQVTQMDCCLPGYDYLIGLSRQTRPQGHAVPHTHTLPISEVQSLKWTPCAEGPREFGAAGDERTIGRVEDMLVLLSMPATCWTGQDQKEEQGHVSRGRADEHGH